MEAQVTLSAAPWSASAAALLAGHETPETVEWFKREVERGRSVLYRVEQGGELLAAVVARIDWEPDGPQGVIASAAGRAGFDLTAEVLPEIERRFSGVNSIRIHTNRAGLCRKLARQGYEQAEIVLRKRVGHGRKE